MLAISGHTLSSRFLFPYFIGETVTVRKKEKKTSLSLLLEICFLIEADIPSIGRKLGCCCRVAVSHYLLIIFSWLKFIYIWSMSFKLPIIN